MTSRVQTQRLSTTGTRPTSGARTPGELWLNLADYRLGMIDPTKAPMDLIPIRVYSSAAGYATGDFVVNGSQLLQARNTIAPKPFALTDWSQVQTTAQTDNRYLLLSGGTLTGPLTLAGNPTVPAQASNKSYVDSTVATNVSNMVSYVNATVASYVPLAGGNMTGALGVGGSGISYPSFGGYWAAHHVAIGWDGTQPEFAADGVGVGALAMQPWTAANFLSINGGTLHGGLNVQGRISWANLGTYAHGMEFGWNGSQVLAWVDGTFIDGLATNTSLGNYLPLTGGVLSGTLRVNNGRLQSSGSGNNPSVSCWDPAANFAAGIWTGANQLNFGGFDGSGTPTAFWGAFDSGGTLHVTGDLLVRGTDIVLSVVSPYYNLYFTNWVLQYDQTHGVLGWYDYTGLQLFYCDPSGNFRAHGDLNAGNGVNANGNIHAGLALQAIDGSMWFGSGGAGRIMQVANSWFWEWNGGNGDLTWTRPGGGAFAIRNSDGVCMDFMGPCGGVGAYQNFSDVRSKFDIAPAIQGLPEVLRLNPKTFKRIGKDRTEIGFIAQDIEQVLPEAVLPLGVPLPDGSGELGSETPSLGFAIDPIVAALVNAIKELASRIAILEANP